MLDGKLPPFFSRYIAIARAICWPRKIVSISRSRWDWCRHTGIAAVIRTAITPSATNNAAIAYPRWPP